MFFVSRLVRLTEVSGRVQAHATRPWIRLEETRKAARWWCKLLLLLACGCRPRGGSATRFLPCLHAHARTHVHNRYVTTVLMEVTHIHTHIIPLRYKLPNSDAPHHLPACSRRDTSRLTFPVCSGSLK